ncbi:MAG TPA: hypothetical protein DCL54_06790 [Alphaproteobacteria bacterium]|nr:hypothetical protein [Alphaproteobacteria bacterium]HAJ46269.1 hypothetical protein [Alphaproteobacteria bacterium]
MRTYRIDLSGVGDQAGFVRAFNAGFAHQAGGEWQGQSLDAFEDLLRWPDDPYTLVFVNGEGLPPALRDAITAIGQANPQAAMVWERDERLMPYGPALAEQVADALARGVQILHTHRDYCGMGLRRLDDGRFCYAQVFDGILDPAYDPAAMMFETRGAFVAWLAQQSDASLDGRDHPDAFFRGNQRLTRARLEAALTWRS